MDIVKMSPKGQLVVPGSIREAAGFEPGDRFIAVQMEEGIAFKRINNEALKKEFEELTEKLHKHFRRIGVTEDMADEAVKWTRKSRSTLTLSSNGQSAKALLPKS
ncbi:MAG: AbrB/MazE/SpoVT family DNA-binding domain-containing protein [Candidatus Woesearchaeota archaeon]